MKMKVKKEGMNFFSPREQLGGPKILQSYGEVLIPNHLAQVPTYLRIVFSFQTSTRTRNKNAVFPLQRPCITSLHDLTTIHPWPFNSRRRRMPTIDFQSLRNFQRGGKFLLLYSYYIDIILVIIIIIIIIIIIAILMIIIIIMFFL